MTERKKPESRTTTFRLKVPTLDLLADASEATGLSMTELVDRCINGELADVVSEVREERNLAHGRFKKRNIAVPRPTVDETALKAAAMASADNKKKRKKN